MNDSTNMTTQEYLDKYMDELVVSDMLKDALIDDQKEKLALLFECSSVECCEQNK